MDFSDREHLLNAVLTESNLQLDSEAAEEKIQIKVFKRRWYIVLIFSAVASAQGGVWNTWGPLADAAKFAFDWSNGTIALLGNWGPIPYVFTAFFFSWLLDTKGLRFAMLLTCFFVWTGTGLRCITHTQPYVTWLMHIGQLLNGAAGPIAMASPPLISALWFPAKQRSTSTGLMFSLTLVFIALSYILGPIAVPGVSKTIREQCGNQSLINITEANCNMHKQTVQQDIMYLMYYEFGIVTVLSILVVIYFPSKPSIPPSVSASVPRVDFKQGIKELSRHYQFWCIALVYGLAVGVLGGWSAVLDVNLSNIDVTEVMAGWIGFAGTCFSQVGTLGSALVSDFFLRRMRLILVSLYTGGTLSFVAFAIVCSDWFDVPLIPSLFVTNCLGNMFLTGASPLIYELSCESAYPVSEGLTAMVITWLINVFALLFLLVLMIPEAHLAWMNWSLAGSCALCIPVLLIYKEKYKRLDVDTMVVEVTISDDNKHLSGDANSSQHNSERDFDEYSIQHT